MSSTIVICFVLVVMWVVVLAPIFVRHRHDTDEVGSVERFAGAMRGLARRPAASAAERAWAGSLGRSTEITTVDQPRLAADTDEADVPVEFGYDGADHDRTDRDAAGYNRADYDRADRYDEADTMSPRFGERPMPAARADMLARRRRTLAAIGGFAVAGVALAILVSPAFWALQVLADVAVVGYLYTLRREIRRERARRARRAARAAPGFRSPAAGGEFGSGSGLEPRSVRLFQPDETELIPVYTEQSTAGAPTRLVRVGQHGVGLVALDEGGDPDFTAEYDRAAGYDGTAGYDADDDLATRRVVNG